MARVIPFGSRWQVLGDVWTYYSSLRDAQRAAVIRMLSGGVL